MRIGIEMLGKVKRDELFILYRELVKQRRMFATVKVKLTERMEKTSELIPELTEECEEVIGKINEAWDYFEQIYDYVKGLRTLERDIEELLKDPGRRRR